MHEGSRRKSVHERSLKVAWMKETATNRHGSHHEALRSGPHDLWQRATHRSQQVDETSRTSQVGLQGRPVSKDWQRRTKSQDDDQRSIN